MLSDKKNVQGLVIALLTIGVFIVLFKTIPLAEVVGLLQTIPKKVWALAVILTLTFPLMVAWRWQVILQALGCCIPFSRSLIVVLGVWPLGTVSPAKSGDLLRAAGLRLYVEPSVCAGSVVAERIADFFVLTMFALTGAIIHRRADIIVGRSWRPRC